MVGVLGGSRNGDAKTLEAAMQIEGEAAQVIESIAAPAVHRPAV
jgi:hypothetical protein